MKMDTRMKFARLLAAACCSLLLLIAKDQQVNCSQYAMTSQYLGAQSRGNEHLLLFKLPKSISSQIQQDQIESRSAHQVDRSQSIYRLSQPPAPEEQSISLTIPLSNLRQEQPQTEVVYKSSQAPPPRYVMTNAGNMQLAEAPQPEYMIAREEPADQKQQQLQHLQSLVTALSRQLARQEQEQQLQDDQARYLQQSGNLSSPLLEQHVHQLLEEQYATTQVPISTEQPQPLLWRDSQRENEVQVGPKTGLLARLTGSSPELRQKLRTILGRMSQQQSANPTSSALNDIDQLSIQGNLGDFNRSRLLQAYEVNNNGSHYPRLQQLAGSSQMLNTFLTSHNLSSHEEIKIPLLVIAMPRILSLKRNQLSSNLPNLTSSSSQPAQPSVVDYAHSLLQRAMNKAPALLLPSNRTNWNQQHNGTDQPHLVQSSNYTGEIVQLHQNNSSPYLYITGSRQLEQPTDDTYQDRHQLVQTTTSMPQYTMAPYARQFSSHSLQQPAELIYRQQYPQVKLQQVSPQNQTLALNQYSAQHRHMARSTAETELVARSAAGHQRVPENRVQEGGMAIQLLSTGPREFVTANQPQPKRQPNQQRQPNETWDESRLYRAASSAQLEPRPFMMHPMYSQQAELARPSLPQLEESLDRLRPLIRAAATHQHVQHSFNQPLSRAQQPGETDYPMAGRVLGLMSRARQSLQQPDLMEAGSQPASLTVDSEQVDGSSLAKKAAQMVLMIV